MSETLDLICLKLTLKYLKKMLYCIVRGGLHSTLFLVWTIKL